MSEGERAGTEMGKAVVDVGEDGYVVVHATSLTAALFYVGITLAPEGGREVFVQCEEEGLRITARIERIPPKEGGIS
jgi:hypothetical protein